MRIQTRLPARDHYNPRESVTRIYFGKRDQAAVLRLSQHRSLAEVSIVPSYSDDNRQAEASNCGVWLLYELAAHAAVCVGVENAADRVCGGHEGNVCGGAGVIAGVNCLTVVPREILRSFVRRIATWTLRLALRDSSVTALCATCNATFPLGRFFLFSHPRG